MSYTPPQHGYDCKKKTQDSVNLIIKLWECHNGLFIFGIFFLVFILVFIVFILWAARCFTRTNERTQCGRCLEGIGYPCFMACLRCYNVAPPDASTPPAASAPPEPLLLAKNPRNELNKKKPIREAEPDTMTQPDPPQNNSFHPTES